MIYPVHQGDIQIDHVHNAALCREISERLVIGLDQKTIGMPLHLMLLMSRLRDEPPKSVNSIR
jgi:hypothetical protein